MPICTQGMQRTWWPEASTIIVTGPYWIVPKSHKLPISTFQLSSDRNPTKSELPCWRMIIRVSAVDLACISVDDLYLHNSDVIMGAMVSQITGVLIVCSTVCSGVDKRKHQSSASLAFVRGINRWPVDSPHKGPVTWKMFPFDDVIMC